MDKLYIIVSFLYCIISHNTITPKAYATDVYTAVALPKEFHLSPQRQCLNNKGIVVGSIYLKQEQVLAENKQDRNGHLLEDEYENAQASYWSEESGLVKLSLKSYKNFGYLINDSGFIIGLLYETKPTSSNAYGRLMAWDININHAKTGPTGAIIAMDDKNNVLFSEPNSNLQHIWNIKENIVEFKNQTLINLPEWKPYKNHSSEGYFNKKLNSIKWSGHDIYFVFEGKNKLLLPSSGIIHGSAWLNDNDEMIALTYLESSTEKISYNQPKLIFSVTKWRNDAIATTSEPISNISALKDYYDFEIKGFNNLGQILILATKRGMNGKSEKHLFLLKLSK